MPLVLSAAVAIESPGNRTMPALTPGEDGPGMVGETADATLIALPLRSLADIEAIERVPLDARLRITDFSQRTALGLAARPPEDTAIFFVPDGDVEQIAERVTFRQLQTGIDQVAALLRRSGIGQGDVVAILLPAVPAQYLGNSWRNAGGHRVSAELDAGTRPCAAASGRGKGKGSHRAGPDAGLQDLGIAQLDFRRVAFRHAAVVGCRAERRHPAGDGSGPGPGAPGARAGTTLCGAARRGYRRLCPFRRHDGPAEDRETVTPGHVLPALEPAAREPVHHRRNHHPGHADVPCRRPGGALPSTTRLRGQHPHPQCDGRARQALHGKLLALRGALPRHPADGRADQPGRARQVAAGRHRPLVAEAQFHDGIDLHARRGARGVRTDLRRTGVEFGTA